MKKSLTVIFGLWLVAAASVAAGESDVAGSKDHPLLSRMHQFHITGYKEQDFDKYRFINKDAKPVVVEGRHYYLQYDLDKGASEPGELKIRRNIQDALKAIGGKVLFDDNFNRVSTVIVQKDGMESWVEVRSAPKMYRLHIVQKKSMEQEVVANAAALGDSIHATGHASVYGIYFDTGLAILKPESDAALNEIAKLLAADTTLKLEVVGHTDNVGSLEANMKLSRDRAEAVVKALTGKYGVAGPRLRAGGVASLCPVASNDTDEGRAKNRRVELVKQ